MSCLGVHFALMQEEVDALRAIEDESERVEYVINEIEEDYFANHREFVVESDKAWDAMHRTLADGKLTWKGGQYPLNHVVLAGEPLEAPNYIMSVKTPKQVQDIAAALLGITEAEFRRRYFAIDPKSYGCPIDEDDFGYTWSNFKDVREFYIRVAKTSRYVLFTADQ